MLLTTIAVIMCLPAIADGAVDNPDWQVFAASALITLSLGICLILGNRSDDFRFTIHQAFLLTTLSWLVIALFGSLPFMFSNLDLSFTDAFFEAMSGITTTGSTVITGLDFAPPGILLWRALLQWLGGIGIIVMAIAVLPMLRVGGMQLFHMESSDTSDKVMPRAAQIASGIGLIYVSLTLICGGALWLSGMSGFQAIAHAMTTIATGGFSTSDDSVGHFNSATIDAIITCFMILGSMPFVLYLQAVRGNVRQLVTDSQVLWFLSIAFMAVATLTVWQWLGNDVAFLEALRYVSFNSVSLMTGTGYSTADFGLWGGFAVSLLFFLMVVGGCAGSTTCGIKIFRFQVLWSAARVQLHHLLQPHGVFIPYYNRRPISDEVIVSVLSFFYMYGICYALLALGLGMLGLDYLSAVSSAATAISNVGPALGPIVGPAGSFQPLPDAAKWLLSAGMLLGRLELFTVIVIFTRSFWRD
ncbi:MAG: TrkH family potassium uptake protein [Rhodospirillales bacterium]|nr:TrkH family potassium uptake protein [Rhodospirillales bacterium]